MSTYHCFFCEKVADCTELVDKQAVHNQITAKNSASSVKIKHVIIWSFYTERGQKSIINAKGGKGRKEGRELTEDL